MARNRFEGKVAVTGRDEKTLREAERQIGAGTLALRADVSRPAELDRAFGEIKQRLGRVDALFVNAGIGKFVPFDQVTEQILGFP